MSETMNAYLDDLRAAARGEREAWKARHLSERESAELKQKIFWEAQGPNLRRATPAEYSAWMRGFLARGFQPTHVYDRAMPNTFYVAVDTVDLPSFCGSAALHIIVPGGISVHLTHGDAGHSTLFYMDNFTVNGSRPVPVFADTVIEG